MWWQVRNYEFERDFNLHFSQKHDEFQCDIRYIQDQQQNIDCHWQYTYILNNQQRNIDWHWQYAYFLFEKLLSLCHFCKDVYFIRKKLLYCNGKIKRMIYFKFYKRRTDYPMDIFILKKMYVWSNGRSTCIWNIFAQRITKNGWEFSISCIQCFAANKMGKFIFKIWKAEQFYD